MLQYTIKLIKELHDFYYVWIGAGLNGQDSKMIYKIETCKNLLDQVISDKKSLTNKLKTFKSTALAIDKRFEGVAFPLLEEVIKWEKYEERMNFLQSLAIVLIILGIPILSKRYMEGKFFGKFVGYTVDDFVNNGFMSKNFSFLILSCYLFGHFNPFTNIVPDFMFNLCTPLYFSYGLAPVCSNTFSLKNEGNEIVKNLFRVVLFLGFIRDEFITFLTVLFFILCYNIVKMLLFLYAKIVKSE